MPDSTSNKKTAALRCHFCGDFCCCPKTADLTQRDPFAGLIAREFVEWVLTQLIDDISGNVTKETVILAAPPLANILHARSVNGRFHGLIVREDGSLESTCTDPLWKLLNP